MQLNYGYFGGSIRVIYNISTWIAVHVVNKNLDIKIY